MSLFADYAAERLGALTIEEEFGFIQYIYLEGGETCYISEMYVAPQFRRFGFIHLKSLIDKVVADAKTKGCKFIMGKIVPSLPGASKVMALHLRYGMKITQAKEDEIWTAKEI